MLTAFAIVLGVAMVSGSFVLTDTLGKTIDGVYEESYKEADAVISSKQAIKIEDGDTREPPFSEAILGNVRELRASRRPPRNDFEVEDVSDARRPRRRADRRTATRPSGLASTRRQRASTRSAWSTGRGRRRGRS